MKQATRSALLGKNHGERISTTTLCVFTHITLSKHDNSLVLITHSSSPEVTPLLGSYGILRDL